MGLEDALSQTEGDVEIPSNASVVPTKWTMVSHPLIFKNFLVMIVSYTCLGTNYHLMTFYMKYIKGDLYFLQILSGVFMILGFLVGTIIQKFISVK